MSCRGECLDVSLHEFLIFRDVSSDIAKKLEAGVASCVWNDVRDGSSETGAVDRVGYVAADGCCSLEVATRL